MTEHITLRGFVGTDPETHFFGDGAMAARFRLATTTRRFDAERQTWVTTRTNWYSIRCYRALAVHVIASIKCGQPVVVTGKLQVQEWVSENGPRTGVVVEAVAVGHDLSFGTAAFKRLGGGARFQSGEQHYGADHPSAQPSGTEPRPHHAPDGGAHAVGDAHLPAGASGTVAGEVFNPVTGELVKLDPDDATFRPLPSAPSPGAPGIDGTMSSTSEEPVRSASGDASDLSAEETSPRPEGETGSAVGDEETGAEETGHGESGESDQGEQRNPDREEAMREAVA